MNEGARLYTSVGALQFLIPVRLPGPHHGDWNG
jgi:hypothetical protein